MAEKDKSQKVLEEYTDVFADIFNALVYKGEQVLDPGKLKQIEGESISSPDGVGLKQLNRDIFMEYADSDTRYLVLGIDDQDDVDNTMPLRGMGMDYASYEKQVRQIMAQNKEAKKDPGGRKIYGHQKLIPVVTLILYFGDSNWNGPKSLKDMLKMPNEDQFPGIGNYIQDYGMNLIVLKNLSEEEEKRFQSDFKYLVKYLRNRKEPDKVVKVYREEFGSIVHQKETMRAMAALTKDERYLAVEEEQEEKNMSCPVLDYVDKQAEERGVVIGEARGEVRGIIQMCQEFGASWEETLKKVMKRCKLEDKLAREYMSQFWQTKV